MRGKPRETLISRLEAGLGGWVLKHRLWIMIVTLLTAAIAASGARFLTFDNDSRVFFSKENPQLQALEALENTYSKDDNLLFVLAPESGDVFSRETLAAVEELTEAAWRLPYSSRVNSITNFQHTRAEGDDLIVEDLVEEARALTPADLGRIKAIALSEPLLVNRILSPSGHVTAVSVNFIKPGASLGEVPELVAFARKLAKDTRRKHPALKIDLTSGVIIDAAFGEASVADMQTLMPAMLVALFVIMGISLRTVSGTFVTLVIIALSTVTGMGLAGWCGISLSPASVNAPIIILTLAVADSVHILVSMFTLLRRGKSKEQAITEALRINLQPVFVTSVTTTIGFLTMNFSDVPPFRDLGNMVAMGVMAAFVYSVLFLPALISMLPVRMRPATADNCIMECDRLADLVINHRRSLFWGLLGLSLIISAGMSRIELDDDFIRYFDQRYDFRRASDFTEQNLTGLNIIEYSLEAGEPGGIHDPAYLAKIEEFANWYRTQPKVAHVNVITDIMKRLNKNMHGDAPSYYRIPRQRELAAQYLLLYEMSLPFGLDLNNRINVDKSATRMTVIATAASTKELRQMDSRARNWLKANAPESMFTYGSGLSIMFAHISERNIRSMLGATFLALLFISTTLIVALRSFKLGALSLVPNLAPVFMAFGIWGIFIGQVGLAVSVLASLTIGIIVDDTVHFISKYLRGRREDKMSPQQAVRFAFNTVGTALWVTTAALLAGFLVLSLSGFKVNHDMGLMTSITIALALVMDFFFLPALLMKMEKKDDA